jgi:TrmH family RNA methyltransferase
MPSLSQSKRLRALHRRKERRTRGEFLVEGSRVLGDLLDSGRLPTLVLYTEAAGAEPGGSRLLERLAENAVPIDMVSEAVLRQHAGTVTPQGWLASALLPTWEWSDVEIEKLVVLDAVQDPGNVGALVRAAEAFGAGGLVALPGTADPWSPKAVRAAAGSSTRFPVLEADWEETARRLREANVAIWVADPEGVPLNRENEVPTRMSLVLGNEGAGVSEPVRQGADRAVAVPMRHPVESLNAALAGAVLMDRLYGG